MNLTCPHCHATFAIECGLTDVEYRAALVPALELPAELSPLILRYLGLFRTGSRVLSPVKVAKLLAELADLIKSERCEFKGEVVSAPFGVWQAGISSILEDRPTELPLKSHGYLKAVVIKLGKRHEAAAEVRAEAAKQRLRIRDGHSPAAQNEAVSSIDQLLAGIRGGTTEREAGLQRIAQLGMSRERAEKLLGAMS